MDARKIITSSKSFGSFLSYWFIAPVIIFLFISGFSISSAKIAASHYSVGISLLLFLIPATAIKSFAGNISRLSLDPQKSLNITSNVTRKFLYFFIIATSLSGYFLLESQASELYIFSIKIPNFIVENESFENFLSSAHKVLSYSLLAIIVVQTLQMLKMMSQRPKKKGFKGALGEGSSSENEEKSSRAKGSGSEFKAGAQTKSEKDDSEKLDTKNEQKTKVDEKKLAYEAALDQMQAKYRNNPHIQELLAKQQSLSQNFDGKGKVGSVHEGTNIAVGGVFAIMLSKIKDVFDGLEKRGAKLHFGDHENSGASNPIISARINSLHNINLGNVWKGIAGIERPAQGLIQSLAGQFTNRDAMNTMKREDRQMTTLAYIDKAISDVRGAISGKLFSEKSLAKGLAPGLEKATQKENRPMIKDFKSAVDFVKEKIETIVGKKETATGVSNMPRVLETRVQNEPKHIPEPTRFSGELDTKHHRETKHITATKEHNVGGELPRYVPVSARKIDAPVKEPYYEKPYETKVVTSSIPEKSEIIPKTSVSGASPSTLIAEGIAKMNKDLGVERIKSESDIVSKADKILASYPSGARGT
jgi:cytochrome b561